MSTTRLTCCGQRTSEHLDHQIATIESLGLTRRFDYDRDKDTYTSHAYA